mmetsp:Transcript_32600/g.81714  ORF Transcript_32600/g.81714 Transcript_32600/m.81714 type:complete len:348 (-) Transcript_32600:3268-4311(-)|eukprot:CAMPEP_0177681414 /NCGR_PEP_ID=MMETSP0447-20121125/30706_1 /TAXON_ID=0 /ORGANISM="Stygamoeba regulata, Strain BSH-02190019" /LENGTH=347 /DNA_ID=CAMNT_0019190835 /DNA_START=39 /DNA_END=1082 /DNA_ORIENTATION=+
MACAVSQYLLNRHSLLLGERSQCNSDCVAKVESLLQRLPVLVQRQNINEEDVSRISNLGETLQLLLNYLGSVHPCTGSIDDFQKLVVVLGEKLDLINCLLKSLMSKSGPLSENFDILELMLRNYLDQMQSMFPCDIKLMHEVASDIIQDEGARHVWARNLGACTRMVDYRTFLKSVVEPELIPQVQAMECGEYVGKLSAAFVQYLEYFLNFPKDGLVTTYKWSRIVSLFGPFPRFVRNFLRFAMGWGFIGLISRLRATWLLQHSPRCSVVIRLSRTHPGYVAFTYKDHTGAIKHRLNADANGKVIPLEVFLPSTFPQYTFVQHRVNVGAILRTSLKDYACSFDGYVQ